MMINRNSLLALFSVLITSCATQPRTQSVYTQPEDLVVQYDRLFPLYPAPAIKTHSPFKKAKIDWSSNAKARKYRRALKTAYAAIHDPNFDGTYILVDDIGCGTACRVVFIIDQRNGAVIDPAFDAPVKFKRDSALIIKDPMCEDCREPGELALYENCLEYAGNKPTLWVFDGKHVNEVKSEECRPGDLLDHKN